VGGDIFERGIGPEGGDGHDGLTGGEVVVIRYDSEHVKEGMGRQRMVAKSWFVVLLQE
jgi:hypothetical protein